jgi:hypothetical protein
MNPYTYLIKHIPTNTFYYGVRWKNIKLGLTPEEDLWKTYFTTSKKVKCLLKKYGVESFEYQIRKTFSNIENARRWESKVLTKMKVLDRPDLWLNRTNNRAILNKVGPRGALGKTWNNPITSQRNKKEKLGNQYTKGTKWVNNGVVRKMIPKNEPVPAGFILGTGRTNKRPDVSLFNSTKHPRLRTKTP